MNAPLTGAARPPLTKRLRLPRLSRQGWEEGVFAAICLLAFALLMVLAQSMNAYALEPVASLSGDRRHALVQGPIACSSGERYELRVSLSQSSSGARGSGRLSGLCEGGIRRWAVDAAVQGPTSFTAGAARVCARGSLRQQGVVIDVQTWCRDIVLVDA